MPSPQLRPKLIAGRYALRRKLGSGSTGSVYLAADTVAGRDVALKLLQSERIEASLTKQMQEEFLALVSLRHPQIARAYDFGYTENGAVPFYTREYIAGSPLTPGPPADESQRPEDFLAPILDALDALDHVHRRGILHMDLHAGNLIVADASSRGAILIDFGLVQPAGLERLSSSSATLGSLPPELFDGEAVTPLTDVYLAGRLLAYRLSGEVEGRPRLPKEIPGWGIRRTLDLERILSKALQLRPEQRFVSAAAFRDAIHSALGIERMSVRRRSGDDTKASDFVGREKPRRKIEESLERAAAGLPAVVWIAGKHGAGKTRLLAESRLRAQLRGLAVVEAAFAKRRDGNAVLVEAFRSSEPAGRSRWLEPLDPRHGGTPAQRAQRAAEACLAEPNAPLVVLLDDFEHADRESRLIGEALLAEAIRRERSPMSGRGVAILVATAQPSREFSKYTSTLRGLRPGEARALLAQVAAPAELPGRLVRAAVADGGGSPLRLRHIGVQLRAEWQRAGTLSHVRDIPPLELGPEASVEARKSLAETDRRVLDALAALDRSLTRDELACAVEIEPSAMRATLRRLTKRELVAGSGRPIRFRLLSSVAPSPAASTPKRELRAMHRRLASWMEARGCRDAREREHLARHVAASGRRGDGRKIALDAARELHDAGDLERATRLLEEFVGSENSPRNIFQLIEGLSPILDDLGDHERGIALIEPFLQQGGKKLRSTEIVRLQRRLGIHLHRAGFPDRAQVAFKRAIGRASKRNLEDLILIDSELAEIQIFDGSLDDAEAACRRGLARIGTGTGDPEFRGRMEVTLRASLGHIELRRLRPDRAKAELETGRRLSRRYSSTADQAAILHNLAVCSNQLNELERAREYFAEAQRLLAHAGDTRNEVKIATNLAVIASKLGDREESRAQIERAERLVRRYPGHRLEFFCFYSKGLAALLLGEADASIAAFDKALPLGRKLADEFLVRFGEVYLAEAALLRGRYAQARAQLHATRRAAEAAESTLLRRMVDSRLVLLETLLGRERAARNAYRALEETPRSGVELAEAWIDLFAAVGSVLAKHPADDLLESAERVFAQLSIPYGTRYVHLARLVQSLLAGDESKISEHAAACGGGESSPHAFLSVAEPLARGAAFLALGQLESAAVSLSHASGAIVGAPFAELDWFLELLHARVASGRSSVVDARRHVLRSVHTRDVLAQLVPERFRDRFLAQRRFAPLDELLSRLQRTPRLHSSAGRGRSEAYEGLVGVSNALKEIVGRIETMEDSDLPVLITGETGVGKEAVARALYRRSWRRDGGFQVIHCGSIPEELFEAELFGYRRGAFTGAEEDRPGLLENLRGGTILFDEIGDLSPVSQGKLVRVVDSSAVKRLGSGRVHPLDIRFLFSSSRDLEALVETGRLRSNLYYRVRALEIPVPPLRERREDIRVLANHFVEKHRASLDRERVELSGDAVELLQRHDWPGNIRELESVIIRTLIQRPGALAIRASDVALATHGGERVEQRPARPTANLLSRDLKEWERDLRRDYLTELFRATRGSVTEMTRRLGIARATLYAWLGEAGLSVESLRARLEADDSPEE